MTPLAGWAAASRVRVTMEDGTLSMGSAQVPGDFTVDGELTPEGPN
jgi:hypothetical protein